jgi:hypothetical protein
MQPYLLVALAGEVHVAGEQLPRSKSVLTKVKYLKFRLGTRRPTVYRVVMTIMTTMVVMLMMMTTTIQ